jgi:hypothetical protein
VQARIKAATPSAVVSGATRRIQGLTPWLADIVGRCADVPVPAQLISHDSTLLTTAAGQAITSAGRWVVSAGVHRPRNTAEGLISMTLHQSAAVRVAIGQALRAVQQTANDCALTHTAGIGPLLQPWDMAASTAFIRRRIPGASRIIMLGQHSGPSTMLTVSRTDRGASEDPSALVCLPGRMSEEADSTDHHRLIDQLTHMVANFPVAFAVSQMPIALPELLTAGPLRLVAAPVAVAFGPRGVLAFGRGLLDATPPETRRADPAPIPAVVFGLESGGRTCWADFADLVRQLGDERESTSSRPRDQPHRCRSATSSSIWSKSAANLQRG